MINCKEAGGLFYGYMDRELNKEEIQHLEKHIKACKGCFGHLEFDQAIRKTLQSSSLKAKLSEETRNLILSKLKSL